MTSAIETVRTIAPEDIAVGRYVAILHERKTYHYHDCESGIATARMTEVPSYPDFPVKIADVCLPYVYVETAAGKTDILDVRVHVLAAVSARFGATIHDRERRLAKRKD